MNTSNVGEFEFGREKHVATEPCCREILRLATRDPHERLHQHAGFSAVKEGLITQSDYIALLIRLYSFYAPFEHAVGVDCIRTRWLARDLSWLGVDASSLLRLPVCGDLPRYDSRERRLGALYVVEGSALGGRVLCRGLDHLLGRDSVDGRRFFAGRGPDTGSAWLGFLGHLSAAGTNSVRTAALVGAAVETFEVFEAWLSGWRDRQ